MKNYRKDSIHIKRNGVIQVKASIKLNISPEEYIDSVLDPREVNRDNSNGSNLLLPQVGMIDDSDTKTTFKDRKTVRLIVLCVLSVVFTIVLSTVVSFLGDYYDSIRLFGIPGIDWFPSNDYSPILTIDTEQYAKALEIDDLSSITVGTYISFGKYEVNDSSSDGQEDLIWQVLEVSGTRVLLITKDIVDVAKFDSSIKDYYYDIDYQHDNNVLNISWEDSSLRAQLNNQFLNRTFSLEERSMLVPIKTNSSGSEFDLVTILSSEDVLKYLPSFEERTAKCTVYAQKRGAGVALGNNNGEYFLKDQGEYPLSVKYVNDVGEIKEGRRVTDTRTGYRPVVMISFEKDTLKDRLKDQLRK